MKYVAVDIESTGLDYNKHSIIEFAAVIDDLKDPQPLASLPRFQCYVTSNKKRVWDRDTLNFGQTKEIAKKVLQQPPDYNYVDESLLVHRFRDFLIEHGYEPSPKNNKVYLTCAGKNFSTFDLRFIEKLPNYEDQLYILHRVLDPTPFYLNYEKDDVLPNMEECLYRLGIKKEVAHTALEDTMDVVKLVRYAYLGEEPRL